MALLSSCWFIIFNVFTSFFVHPLLLGFCQLFLWIKFLGRCFSNLFNYPLWIMFSMISSILRFLRCCSWLFLNFLSCTVSWIQSRDNKDANSDCCRVLSDMDESRTEYQKRGFEKEEDGSTNMIGYLNRPAFFVDHHITTDKLQSYVLFNSSELHNLERERENNIREEDVDGFYQKYTERMNWFDLLNYERTCGLSAILNKQLGNWSFAESPQSVNLTLPSITWSKVGKKNIIKSLESDFETVYVGQSCLCWEALHHQYMKMIELTTANDSKSHFYEDISVKFQQFRVLLERFMENENCQGERFWNYAQSRFSHRNLLQVPTLTGHLEEERMKMNGEALGEVVVLKDIEESIMVFWAFLRAERKNALWKCKDFFWTKTHAKGSIDLELLLDVTKTLQKKEQGLKALKRRKRCWLKGANPVEESEKLNIVSCMIDIKLIARVLKMSMISTNHLKWCQEKLRNIEFEDGKVKRIPCAFLFPPP